MPPDQQTVFSDEINHLYFKIQNKSLAIKYCLYPTLVWGMSCTQANNMRFIKPMPLFKTILSNLNEKGIHFHYKYLTWIMKNFIKTKHSFVLI